ncbi:CopG family transcriptional regulator [Runella slithyformis]|uniref:CopG-like domain-containing protein DNA-binding n=1 Tax=Runella slithyformis (strain ATCC 29530 / DSM 19594 / LMG 11500 / NCIMB 11436 / LSU 4) TaxID=761193 RepID=A0A7U3ZNT9_RUNSL|nr:CopG family transcriptional regulator [Runella slithyformis]AEI50626.1 CopG-like domain-containing protein DNA-binding [Runella slithyformis DSM 19594]
MNTKDQTINFRVDDSTKQLLKDLAQELHLKESEFIRKAIVGFKELTGQVQAAALDREIIQEQEAQLKQLRYLLEGYEKNETFTTLFKNIKGHTIEGKKICSKSDLIELLAKSAAVEIVEATSETEEATVSISPVVLQAHVTPETVEEPITRQHIMDFLKRNWLWLVGMGLAVAAFVFWRWTTTMKLRPKIIQYSPSKSEETLLAA